MVGYHRVTKVIEFCYGHRLLHYDGKCRFLHGHNGRLEIDVEAPDLDGLGMVMDFGDVQARVKQWVDDNLDHRMLLCEDDPALPVLREMGEPVFAFHDNPTAENISRLVYHEARERGVPVREVRLWETPTSYATYGEIATGMEGATEHASHSREAVAKNSPPARWEGLGEGHRR